MSTIESVGDDAEIASKDLNAIWPIIASGVGFGVQNAMHGATFGRYGRAVDLVMLFFVYYVNVEAAKGFPVRAQRKGDFRLPLIAFLAFANLWQLIQGITNPDAIATASSSLDVFYRNIVCTGILYVIFFKSRRLDAIGGVLAVCAGFAVCGILNLVCDRFFFRMEVNFDESRFDFLDGRWAPPLSRSAVSLAFSTSVSAAVLTCGLLRRIWARACGPLSMAVALGSAAVVAYVTVRCQFRAHLATLAAGVAFGLAPVLGVRLLCVGAIGGFICVPLLFSGDIGGAVLQVLPLDRFLQQLGSSSEGASTLSDRSYLYQYGWDRLFTGANGVFGDGPFLRDSWPGLGVQDFNLTLNTRHAFHNGLLDILVVYGWAVGLLFLSLGFLRPVMIFIKRIGLAGQGTRERDQIIIGITYFSCWMTMSTIDTGLSYGPEFFAIFLMPVLACLPARRIREAAPETSHSFDPAYGLDANGPQAQGA